MVAAGVLFLFKVEQKVKCFSQNIKGIPQDVKVNLIIRGKETVYCGRISRDSYIVRNNRKIL